MNSGPAFPMPGFFCKHDGLNDARNIFNPNDVTPNNDRERFAWARRNIMLTIAYDGTNYRGWQIQPNGLSVQECVETAVEKLTGERQRVYCAGRTDSGVHALGQVANFPTTAVFRSPTSGEVCSLFCRKTLSLWRPKKFLNRSMPRIPPFVNGIVT